MIPAGRNKGLIRVLIVEDSPTMALALQGKLNSSPDFGVIGIARDGREAVKKALALKPDLITMDVHLPLMDGLEATKEIMAQIPTPIVIVSRSVFTGDTSKVFKAISRGALDVINKDELLSPKTPGDFQKTMEQLRFFAGVKVIRHPKGRTSSIKAPAGARKNPITVSRDRVIAIVGSTGGPRALNQVLKTLPGSLPWPILAVIHISSGFDRGLAEWLDRESELNVHVAKQGEKIKAGEVYIAPSDFHMRVLKDRTIDLGDDPPRTGLKPCGDYLLESVGENFREDSVGIILTGMGKDGSLGVQKIRDSGGRTMAQDELSSAIFGMPRMAIQTGKVDEVLPLDSIAPGILSLLGRRKSDR